MDLKLLWKIFLTFFKIGPSTFGGGYAMIPLLEKAIVDRNGWMKKEEITDVLAVSQTIPGSVAVNAATFVGYRLAGILGATTATIGVIIPTFIIILLLGSLFLGVQHLPIVKAAFLGIRPSIVALILFAAFKSGKTSILDKTTGLVGISAVAILLFTPVSPIFVILIGAVAGIAFGRKKSSVSTKKVEETDLDHSTSAGI